MGVITMFMSIASMTNQPCPMIPHNPPTSCQCLYTTSASANKELPHIQLMANGSFLLQDFDNNFHAMVLASKITSILRASSVLKFNDWSFSQNSSVWPPFSFLKTFRFKNKRSGAPCFGWVKNKHHPTTALRISNSFKKKPKKMNGWTVEAKQLEVWFTWFSFSIFGDF